MNLSKVTHKIKARKQQVTGSVDLETIFADRDLFMSFKEFLIKKQALENLSFWVECGKYFLLRCSIHMLIASPIRKLQVLDHTH